MAILTQNPNIQEGDSIDAQIIKDTIETALNANKLTQPIDNSQANKVGIARLERDPVTGGLKAIELKGEQGIQGETGANAVITWGINAPSQVSTIKWRTV